jgi:hypothetical protein
MLKAAGPRKEKGQQKTLRATAAGLGCLFSVSLDQYHSLEKYFAGFIRREMPDLLYTY